MSGFSHCGVNFSSRGTSVPLGGGKPPRELKLTLQELKQTRRRVDGGD